LRETRSNTRAKFEKIGIEAQLFKPDFTDDDSEDHDNSEEESQLDD